MDMSKAVFTLNVDDYAPEICEITYPFLERYADKIGAHFIVINERRFPDWPPVYEKLQIKQLAEDMGVEWAIYFDSDALVHPETIDFTAFVPRDTVLHNGSDMAAIRWRYDKYFLRDGRNIGSCNWFTIASDWCLDLWTPLDITLEEALAAIRPTVFESQTVITADHLIDDYTLSRNIARYGLKHTTAIELLPVIGLADANFFHHEYTTSTEEKVENLRRVVDGWLALPVAEPV